MTGLRAILVCVDFADLLQICMSYDRHHYDEVCVVTSSADIQTQCVAETLGCKVFITDSFYQDGAIFNKWRALEEGLDWFGRHGWLCIRDVDIVWPKKITSEISPMTRYRIVFDPHFDISLGLKKQDVLISPLRRMMTDISKLKDTGIPPEDTWKQFDIHRNVEEWAGYSQIFHADCTYLGKPPWHEIDWTHAGGADSFFQQKWPNAYKIRPSWECLHLGRAGVNWHGRSINYLDGTAPLEAKEREEKCIDIWANRRNLRQAGLDQFKDEKINRTSE